MTNRFLRTGIRVCAWALAAQVIACSSSDSSGGTSVDGGAISNGGAGAGGGSSGGASAGGTGSGGTAASGGTSGAGGNGTGGLGAGGSAATPQCPKASPTTATACTGVPDSCFYEDCGGVGRVSARCTSGAWVLETGVCGVATCGPGPTTCTAGQACVQRAGGAVFTDCTANHCGGGPVQCDCIEGCSPGCFVTGSVYSGIFVSCNTCPSGQCP